MLDNNLSIKANCELGFILFSGIDRAIEKNELDREILEEMVEFYNKTILISGKILLEKLNR